MIVCGMITTLVPRRTSRPRVASRLAALLALVQLAACGVPRPDGPLEPTAATVDPAQAQPLQVWVSLPKALLGVVHRVLAVLTGPGQEPIVRQLSVSPLGPATGTLGALQPGSGRTLTIVAFGVDGDTLFVGLQENITIAVGETTAVHVQLEPAPPSARPAGPQPLAAGAAAGTGPALAPLAGAGVSDGPRPAAGRSLAPGR